MTTFTQFLENEEDEIEYQGSVNFMDRIKSGYTKGQPKYASYEPHHQRHPGGAWTYVNMFHKETEDELIAFFDDQTIDEITVNGCIWSKKEGLRLIRSAGNHVEEIKVPHEKNGKVITINSYSHIMVFDQKGNQKNFNDADDDQDEFEYFDAKLDWYQP